MTRPPQKEMDCTNVLPVPFRYDRLTELGVPYDNPKWKAYGTREFYETLKALGEYMDELGFFKSENCAVKFVLTGGLYVNKPGAHGRGEAGDFDGFQMEDGIVHLYKPMMETISDGIRIKSMSRGLACQIAAAISLFFGLVLTWRFNKRHFCHIHFDMSRPVGWRKKPPGVRKSQTVLLQEILVYYYSCSNLIIDGIFGSITQHTWLKAMGELNADGTTADRVDLEALWLRTLREVAVG